MSLKCALVIKLLTIFDWSFSFTEEKIENQRNVLLNLLKIYESYEKLRNFFRFLLFHVFAFNATWIVAISSINEFESRMCQNVSTREKLELWMHKKNMQHNTRQNTRFYEIVKIQTIDALSVSWCRAVRSLGRTVCYEIFVARCDAEPLWYRLHHWALCSSSGTAKASFASLLK